MLQIFSYLTTCAIIPNTLVGRMPKFIQSLNKYLLGMCRGGGYFKPEGGGRREVVAHGRGEVELNSCRGRGARGRVGAEPHL